MRGAFDFWRVVESNNKNDDTCIGIGITEHYQHWNDGHYQQRYYQHFNNQTL